MEGSTPPHALIAGCGAVCSTRSPCIKPMAPAARALPSHRHVAGAQLTAPLPQRRLRLLRACRTRRLSVHAAGAQAGEQSGQVPALPAAAAAAACRRRPPSAPSPSPAGQPQRPAPPKKKEKQPIGARILSGVLSLSSAPYRYARPFTVPAAARDLHLHLHLHSFMWWAPSDTHIFLSYSALPLPTALTCPNPRPSCTTPAPRPSSCGRWPRCCSWRARRRLCVPPWRCC